MKIVQFRLNVKRLYRPLGQSILGLIATICMAPSSAHAAHRECFRDHMRNAIRLNQSRSPLYSSLTNGDSNWISFSLVHVEKLTLLFSHLTFDFDSPDFVYQDAGLQVVCDDFVSMSKVPSMTTARLTAPPKLNDFKKVDTDHLKARLALGLTLGSFSGVIEEARQGLRLINGESRMNCLLRHTLESIVRIATLAPKHELQALKLRLPSPRKLEEQLIESHWRLLDLINDLDEDAAEIQAMGVPIICGDVPPLTQN